MKLAEGHEHEPTADDGAATGPVRALDGGLEPQEGRGVGDPENAAAQRLDLGPGESPKQHHDPRDCGDRSAAYEGAGHRPGELDVVVAVEVRPVEQHVVHCLGVERLLDLGERGDHQVRQDRDIQEVIEGVHVSRSNVRSYLKFLLVGLRLVEDAAAGDHDLLGRLVAAAGLGRLDGPHHVEPVEDLAEHDVAAVEPRGHDGRDEELRPVRVAARVRHRQQPGAVVLELKVLVGEARAVDALAAAAVAAGEVAALDHEVLDHAVELGALVAEAVLAGRELAEVARGLGDDVAVEPEHDAAELLAALLDVEVHAVGHFGAQRERKQEGGQKQHY